MRYNTTSENCKDLTQAQGEKKMNQDLQKFLELLKTDKDLQEKMKASAENYTGEKSQEDVFRNLILPAAEKAGFHFSWEEYQEALKQEISNVQKMDLDELSQVAGGDTTYGSSAAACYKIGLGAGIAVNINDDETASELATFCWIIGFGEASACIYQGASSDVTNRQWNYGDDYNGDGTDW